MAFPFDLVPFSDFLYFFQLPFATNETVFLEDLSNPFFSLYESFPFRKSLLLVVGRTPGGVKRGGILEEETGSDIV